MKRKIDEVKSIRILKSRNGVALIAVLGVLLVLTVLLPTMFSMSEVATMEAAKGTDRQRAAYLARTNIEMSVAAFEDIYNCAFGADANMAQEVSYDIAGLTLGPGAKVTAQHVKDALTPFFDERDENEQTLHPLDMGYVIMYTDKDEDPATNGGTKVKYLSVTGISRTKTDPEDNTKIIEKETKEIVAELKQKLTANQTFIGFSTCNVNYDASIDYYQIDQATGDPKEITESEYEKKRRLMEKSIKDETDYTGDGYQYTQIHNRNIVFTSYAYVNGKSGSRKCVLVLPTEPDDQEWILPASVGSNQVFPNTAKATGIIPLKYNTMDSSLEKEHYVHQPLYTFSCLGNMRISFDYLRDPDDPTKLYAETQGEDEQSSFNANDLTFGLFPEVGTIPANDPTFSCLRAYNMASWYDTDAQRDNFVAFTATNAIQVDCPISLFVNPCRTDRLGDGIAIKIGNFIDVGDKNHSLYKVMMLQAPTIYFKNKVECMVSLYTPPASKNNEARRMSTVVLSAPKSTPYSYINVGRNKDGSIKTSAQISADSKDGKVVKAGMVYFAADAYIWVVPYLENGSPYSEHWYELSNTVYYKATDMKCYKLANAGDVYYFNSEVTTDQGTNMGFSLSGYFMDVIYPKYSATLETNVGWWNVWSKAKQDIFNLYMTSFTSKNYCEQDFYYLGNVGDDDSPLKYPEADDYYIVWDS